MTNPDEWTPVQHTALTPAVEDSRAPRIRTLYRGVSLAAEGIYEAADLQDDMENAAGLVAYVAQHGLNDDAFRNSDGVGIHWTWVEHEAEEFALIQGPVGVIYTGQIDSSYEMGNAHVFQQGLDEDRQKLEWGNGVEDAEATIRPGSPIQVVRAEIVYKDGWNENGRFDVPLKPMQVTASVKTAEPVAAPAALECKHCDKPAQVMADFGEGEIPLCLRHEAYEAGLRKVDGQRPKYERQVVAMADRSGVPEVDRLIEDFLKEPVEAYGGNTPETILDMRDPANAHGLCQAVTEQFVEFAKARGFKAYATDTDLDEMGYQIQPGVQGGEIGFDENDQMQYGFYPEHTVATIVLNDPDYPYGREIYIDFTASQYGYTDHPKVSKTAKADHPGAMVSLYIPLPTARKLETGHEPADELHVTIAVLTDDAESLDDKTRDRIRKALSEAAERHPALHGEVGGTGTFIGGDKPVQIALPDLPGLAELHADVVSHLGKFLDLASDHGYNPHATMAYGLKRNPLKLDEPMPLNVTRMTLTMAGEREHFKLIGTESGWHTATMDLGGSHDAQEDIWRAAAGLPEGWEGSAVWQHTAGGAGEDPEERGDGVPAESVGNPLWPTADQVVRNARDSIEDEFQGVRDAGLIDSAIGATRAQWDYSGITDLVEIAAHLANNLQRQQALVDGNKRTALATMLEFLYEHGYHNAPKIADEDLGRQIEKVGSGEVSVEDFARYLRSRLGNGYVHAGWHQAGANGDLPENLQIAWNQNGFGGRPVIEASIDGEVIGELELADLDDTPSIEWVGVAPDFQRRGIAKVMLDFARQTHDVQHSPERTGDGDAWVQGIGEHTSGANGDLPEGLTFRLENRPGFAQGDPGPYPTVVAMLGGQEVGYLMMHLIRDEYEYPDGESYDPAEYEVYMVRVDDDMQRRGIADAMMEWANEEFAYVHHSNNFISDEGRAWGGGEGWQGRQYRSSASAHTSSANGDLPARSPQHSRDLTNDGRAWKKSLGSQHVSMPYSTNVWYHVTSEANLQSIRDHGLVPTGRGMGNNQNWDEYSVVTGGVYISPNVSSAEANRHPDSGLMQQTGWQDQGNAAVILQINGLDQRRIFPDPEELVVRLQDLSYGMDPEELEEYPQPIQTLMQEDVDDRSGAAIWEAIERMNPADKAAVTQWYVENSPNDSFVYLGTIPAQYITVMNHPEDNEWGDDEWRQNMMEQTTHGLEDDSDEFANQYKKRPLISSWSKTADENPLLNTSGPLDAPKDKWAYVNGSVAIAQTIYDAVRSASEAAGLDEQTTERIENTITRHQIPQEAQVAVGTIGANGRPNFWAANTDRNKVYDAVMDTLMGDLRPRTANTRWVEGDVSTYYHGLEEIDQRSPGFVTVYPEDHYRQPNVRVFTSPDGDVGFNLTDLGDGRIEIAGVFNWSGTKGAGKEALQDARRMGGNYLECYDGILPYYYQSTLGALPHSDPDKRRLEWDDQYRHERWQEDKYGTPGVFSMEVPSEEDHMSQDPEQSKAEFERRYQEQGGANGVPPDLHERAKRYLASTAPDGGTWRDWHDKMWGMAESGEGIPPGMI